MKLIILILSVIQFFIYNRINSQDIRIVFKSNEYYKRLQDNTKVLTFYIFSDDIDQKKINEIEKFVQEYRGVINFSIVKENNLYKASGIFYEYANNIYFKNLFKLLNIKEFEINNVVRSIDDFNLIHDEKY